MRHIVRHPRFDAVFLGALGVLILGPRSAPAEDTLVPPAATWRYDDTGTDLGTTWRDTGFDDSLWAAGPAELGYGDGDEATVLSFGPDPDDKYPCTYFRHPVDVSDPSIYDTVTVRVVRDDGCVVYLNGQEIGRSNMPSGEITYGTWASSPVSGADESAWHELAVDPGLLVPGTNVVAVEVHQVEPWSSDLSFDLALVATDGGGDPTLVKGPYLQFHSDTTMVVMWESDTPTPSLVEYALPPDPPIQISPVPNDPVLIHEVVIPDLVPATRYDYRVSTDGNGFDWTDTYTLTTAPSEGEPFTMAVYGDSRTDFISHGLVVESIIQSAPEWVMNLGDLVGLGQEYESWATEFFEPAHDLMVDTPMLPVIGNHEYDGVGQLWFFDLFSLPGNEEWFAFTHGCARFVALNTCTDDGADFSPGSPQYQWLVDELESAEFVDAAWRIVSFHHPAYTSGSHALDPETLDIQTHLVPLFEAHGVELVLTAHDHFYEHSVKEGVHYIVSGGGGGPLRSINVYSNPYQVVAESVFHHCVLDFTPTTLQITALRNDHTIVDSFSLENDPINHPPVAYDQQVDTLEDEPVEFELQAYDEDEDPLVYIIDASPIHGVLETLGGPWVRYTPAPDFNGTDVFQFHVNDGELSSGVATVTITVEPVNDPPEANDDGYGVDQDEVLQVPAPGVLDNDTDVEGDPLSALLIEDVSHGTLDLQPDGSFTYTPDPGFSGADGFVYRAFDGFDESNDADVTLTVAPRLPVADLRIGLTKQVVWRGWKTELLDAAASRIDALTAAPATISPEIAVAAVPYRWWRVTATVTVRETDADGPLQVGAQIAGHWSGGYSAQVTGTTNDQGQISFRTGRMRWSSSPVMFTVDGVTVEGVPQVLSGEITQTISR